MEKLPSHRKYRPQTFDEIIGNISLIESLKTILEKGFQSSTFLLQGLTGCGKTTIARIIAKEVGARDKDIKEWNVANTRGIDAARSIIDDARFIPFGGKAKVYILDEIHKSTADFQNALLKILEEPPKNTYFILCTTEPEKLLKTVKTRCVIYQVNSLRRNELNKLIKKVLIKEGRRRFPKEAIEQITIAADGCPRQALVILDSIIDIKDNEKLLSAINDFSLHKEAIIDLCRALLNKTTWKDTAKIIKGIEDEPESIRYAVLGYMSNVLLSGKTSDRAFLIIEEFKESFMYTKKAGLVAACYSTINM